MVYYRNQNSTVKGRATLKTAIVTDTNSSITPQEAREMGIYLVSMPFSIDGTTYWEGKNCTPEDFFRWQQAGAKISTSQPSLEEITALWEDLLLTHDAVLHFPMSSGLSGSCQTAKALAQEYDGRVLVVDDRRLSLTMAQSIRNAQVLLAQGRSAEEVRDILEKEGPLSSIYVAVSTLEYLRKGGRMTAAGAAMAAILHIKPVLQLQGGKLDAYKKVRGMVHAKKVMIEALRHDQATRWSGLKRGVSCGYSGRNAEAGAAWQKEVQAAFPEHTVPSISLPLSICCHTGEGAVGLGCAKVW